MRRLDHKRIIIPGVLLMLPLLALVGLWWAAPSHSQTSMAADWISDLLSGTGYQVKIRGLKPGLPNRLGIESITLSDGDGEWLAVQDVSLRLALTELVKKRFHVTTAEIGRMDLYRLPQVPGAPAEKPGPAPQLPEIQTLKLPQVKIDDLSIPELAVHRPLLDETRVLKVTGRMAAQGERAEGGLEVRSVGEPLTRLAVDAALDTAKRPVLNLDLSFSEAPGGVVMALVGLDAGRSELILKGSGPLTGWTGRLEASAERLGRVRTDLNLGLEPEAASVGLEGSARVTEALYPETAAAYTGRRADYRVRARLAPKTGGWNLNLDQFDLRTDKAALSAGGRAAAPERTVDIDYRVEITDVAEVERASGVDLTAPIELAGRAEGAVLAPRLTAALTTGAVGVSGLSLAGLRLDLTVDAPDGLAQGLSADGRLAVRGLDTPHFQPTPETVKLHFLALTNDYRRVDIQDLKLDGDWVRLAAVGDVNLTSLDHALTTDLTVTDLSRLQGAAGMPLAGRFHVTVDTSGRIPEKIQAKIQGGLNGLAGPPEELLAVLGRSPEFSVDAVYGRELVEVRSVEIDGVSRLSGQGKVDLAEQTITARLDGQLAGLTDLAGRYGVRVRRPVDLAARASGPLAGPDASFKLETGQVGAEGRTLDRILLEVNASGLNGGGMSGRVSLTARRGRQRADAAAGWSVSPGRAAITGLTADLPGARIAADLDAALGARVRADGRVEIDAPDLGALGDFTGLPLAGSVRADVALHNQDGQSVQADGDLKQFRFGDAALPDLAFNVTGRDLYRRPRIEADLDAAQINAAGWSVGRADASIKGGARGGDPVKSFSGQVQVAVSDVHRGEVRIDKAELNASGDLDRADVDFKASGRADHPFDAAVAVQIRDLDPYAPAGEVTVERLRVDYQDRSASLAQPAQVRLDDEGARIQDFDLKVADARVAVNGRLSSDAVEGRLTVDHFALSVLEPWVPLKVKGDLSGRITVDGTPRSPRVDAAVQIKGFEPETKNRDPIESDLDLTAGYRDNRLTADLAVTGVAAEPVDVRADLPARLSLRPFQFEMPKNEPMTAEAAGRLDLAAVPRLAGLDGQIMSGRLDLDLKAGGTLSVPDLSGRVTVADGAYENVPAGVILKEIQMELAGDQGRLELRRFTASDGGDGRIQADATVDIGSLESLTYQAELDLNQAQIVRLDLVTTTINGQVQLSGRTDRADLKADLTADPTEIHIPKRLPAGVTSLEVREINVPGGKEEKRQAESGPPMVVDLDVKLNIPARCFVRSDDMDTEWSGRLDASGTSEKPVLEGKLNLIRGRFSFLGKRFSLTRGSITLDGSMPPSPWLQMTGEAKAKDVTAQIMVSGTPSHLSIELASQPPLPRDEILARILFGRQLDNITPMQALALARVANQMTGGHFPSLDLMGKTRQLLGLDRLEMVTGESGNPAVGAGKYITDKVYVKAEAGAEPEDQKVTVEIEVLPNVNLESEVGADSQGGVGLSWKMDY